MSTLREVCTALSPEIVCLCKPIEPCEFLSELSVGVVCDIIRGKLGGPGVLDIVTVVGTGIIDGVLCGDDSGRPGVEGM